MGLTWREALDQLLELLTVAARERRGVGGREGEDVLQLRQHLRRAPLGLLAAGVVHAQRRHLVRQLVGFLLQLPAAHKTSSVKTQQEKNGSTAGRGGRFLPEGAGKVPDGAMAAGDAQGLGVQHGGGDGALLADGESQQGAEDGVDGGGREVVEVQPSREKLGLDVVHTKIVWERQTSSRRSRK